MTVSHPRRSRFPRLRPRRRSPLHAQRSGRQRLDAVARARTETVSPAPFTAPADLARCAGPEMEDRSRHRLRQPDRRRQSRLRVLAARHQRRHERARRRDRPRAVALRLRRAVHDAQRRDAAQRRSQVDADLHQRPAALDRHDRGRHRVGCGVGPRAVAEAGVASRCRCTPRMPSRRSSTATPSSSTSAATTRAR